MGLTCLCSIDMGSGARIVLHDMYNTLRTLTLSGLQWTLMRWQWPLHKAHTTC